MASSLAPQESYEFSQRSGSEFFMKLTGHNAAGHTTTSISMGGASLVPQAAGETLQEAPRLPLHEDPRLLASAVASTLALTLTVAAVVLCVRKSKNPT